MPWLTVQTIRSKIIMLALAGGFGFVSYFSYGMYLSLAVNNEIADVVEQRYPTLHLIDSIWLPLNDADEKIADAISE